MRGSFEIRLPPEGGSILAMVKYEIRQSREIFAKKLNMTNEEIAKYSINKDDLCKIMTPELINSIVDGIWWAEDNGWEEREK